MSRYPSAAMPGRGQEAVLTIEAFILSILVGWIRKGKLSNLNRIPLRRLYVFILPFALLALVNIARCSSHAHDFSPYTKAANIAQFAILIVATALNFHIFEMRIAGSGAFLNLVVIAVNGGIMPVSHKALSLAGLADAFSMVRLRHAMMTDATHLKFLADVIPIGGPHAPRALQEVASIGDVFVAVAVFILIQRDMCMKNRQQSEDGRERM